ncbi:Tubulin-specific chaperone D [Hondaea fermentalgiana]|uniref:Tubulin-specific chaperone D n=1 Tax=Hondaea fermentalgiana TaxID=2315210 RepID=A0A2R5GKZ4_9STRA|nr:Tubulin-specific chaperone D [Hondaea fermentalgiana]|eukprot:GBG28544.1 Tubulin-specific chaperone D [Hondaea fermentalgiana]
MAMNVVQSENDHFLDKDECLALLDKVCASVEVGHRLKDAPPSPAGSGSGPGAQGAETLAEAERALDGVQKILEKYQEQAHLLDRHLEDLVTRIMDAVKHVLRLREADEEARPSRGEDSAVNSFPFQVYRNAGLQLVLKALYLLCKVRGYKAVVKQLPHEVADLEPTLWLLQCQDAKDYTTWETRYSLLLWLSMLVLIPFDLETVDSSLAAGTTGASQSSLVATVTDLCKAFLNDSGATREAAAICLARLLTRPDMESVHLEGFLNWAADTLEDVSDRREGGESRSEDPFLITGIFHALVEIFKHGHREKLLSHIPVIFSRVLRISNRDGQVSSLERKLTVKLVQRAGLNFLPPRVVKWRYQRGQRSLLQNLAKSAPAADADGSHEHEHNEDLEEDEDDADIPEEVEDVVEKLLSGLRDRDTIVRWSAAKGIGRVTSRLPESHADDVVAFVLELFDASEGDAAWHGGCLALAELARRGLLLPKRLGAVVPFVVQALIYDVRRGHNSVGANVRDAACYVCWAFARAYEPAVMAPHVSELCPQMMVTAVFDREVNCRRAASAAFQENVGRQGHDNFPHGIEILTAADYFTLGIRKNAYLEIAPFVARFDVYRRPLIEHLVNYKLSHWDLQLRMLSADALHVLTASDPTFMAETVLRDLLPKTLSPDVLVRHGATLAVSTIVAALAKVPYRLSDEMRADVRNTVMRIEKGRWYRGRGGEWIRVAACKLIEAMARAGHQLSRRAQIRLLESVEESLKHPKDEVKEAAVAALAALADEYFGPDANAEDGADALYEVANAADFSAAASRISRPLLPQMLPPVAADVTDRLVARYCQSLETPDPNPAVRRGCALALGVLPARMLGADRAVLERVVKCLAAATRLEDDPDLRDAETRRNAVISLAKLASTVGVTVAGAEKVLCTATLDKELFTIVIDALLGACEDYETDNRGDVGSWVRVVAIKGLVTTIRAVRTFPQRALEAARAVQDDQAEIIASVGDMGRVRVLRYCADGAAAWVETLEPSGRAVKLPAGDLKTVESNERFSVPSEDERSAIFLPDAGARAIQSVMRQEPIADLGNYYPSAYSRLLDEPSTARIVCAIIKQLCEKMGQVRESAGEALVEILKDADSPAQGIPLAVSHVDVLREIFDQKSSSEETNWKVESYTFPRVSQVLALSDYVNAALSGLVLSVGDLTESVSSNAADALLDWCKAQKARENYTQLTLIAKALVRIIEDNGRVDRVVVPALKALDLLLAAEVFNFPRHPRLSWLLQTHDVIKQEIKGAANVSKLVNCSRVLFHLASFEGPIRPVALSSVLILLGHKFPLVRMSCAKDFNMWALAMDGTAICGPGNDAEAVLSAPVPEANPSNEGDSDFLGFLRQQNVMYEQELADRPDAFRPALSPDFDPEQAFEDAQDLIAETRWDTIPVRRAREQRDKLYELLRVQKPEGRKTAASAEVDSAPAPPAPTEEEDSYATLIHNTQMGY